MNFYRFYVPSENTVTETVEMNETTEQSQPLTTPAAGEEKDVSSRNQLIVIWIAAAASALVVFFFILIAVVRLRRKRKYQEKVTAIDQGTFFSTQMSTLVNQTNMTTMGMNQVIDPWAAYNGQGNFVTAEPCVSSRIEAVVSIIPFSE